MKPLTTCLLLYLLLSACAARVIAAESRPPSIVAARCAHNPLVTADTSPTIRHNINGPSVIRAPDWLPQRLGRYYMYFAHHRGTVIRLAYADELCGEWKIYEPGTLRLDQAIGFEHHIASPDVHVDERERRIRMYFHGRKADGRGGQRTGVAVSRDGLHFEVVGSDLGLPYFRVFEWRDAFYAIAKLGNRTGRVLRSSGATNAFTGGSNILPLMRHAAVLPRGDSVLVFFSRIGDTPELIRVASMTIDEELRQVQMSPSVPVLEPDRPYEGGDLPIEASEAGPTKRARQLRDPAILEDAGRVYLFYTIAGETGIALAELEIAQ